LQTTQTLLEVLYSIPATVPAIAACAIAAAAAAAILRGRAAGRRPALGSEQGSMLIEVMVGAVVLAITTTAILNGLDGAQKTGGRNTARSVAASLAEQDQERMRAMPPASLVGYSNTRTVTVRGATYTITSRASWALDASSAGVSCSTTAKPSANLRIVSEVTSPLTRGVVDQASLVTPAAGTYGPGEGTVGVKVVDRNNDPIQGVNVSLSGPSSYSTTTNELGCAVFQYIRTGDYDADASYLSLVGWQGQSPVEGSVSSVQGTSNVLQLEMDRPAAIDATFRTVVGGTTVASQRSRWITISNAKLDAPFTKLFTLTSAAPANDVTVSATGLYPFLDGYGVWAGACAANNPTTSPNTGTIGTATVTPGNTTTLTGANAVLLPAINLRVSTSTSGSPPAAISPAATIKVTTDDAGCTNTFPDQTSNASGALPLPGHPYGRYRICAQRTVSGTTSHGHADVRTGTGYETGHVNNQVTNFRPAGNTTTYGNSGYVRIVVNQTGACH
jgi:Tfp pilus assembly protein PilV